MTTPSPMRGRKKAELPSKVCQRCARPFTWRKKWERDWDNVKFCSDRCRTSTGALSTGRPK